VMCVPREGFFLPCPVFFSSKTTFDSFQCVFLHVDPSPLFCRLTSRSLWVPSPFSRVISLARPALPAVLQSSFVLSQRCRPFFLLTLAFCSRIHGRNGVPLFSPCDFFFFFFFFLFRLVLLPLTGFSVRFPLLSG